MLKFNEQKQIESVNGALALRNQINELIDGICKEGYKNICWLGIGGTYASCLQAEVHMKEKSELSFFVENAAEYLTTGNKKVGEGTIVIISSVTGTTSEIVDGVKKAQKSGARVIGFIDVATAELAKLVDYVITYPANEQLKFYMVADRFMYNAGEFPEYEDLYKELDQYLATALVEVEKEADAFASASFYSACFLPQPTREAVSMAIISSSLVGMSRTLTLESVAEITRSSPRTLLASSSIFTPMYSRPDAICIRSSASFSPTPAVKMMASTPPMTAAYAPMSFLTS